MTKLSVPENGPRPPSAEHGAKPRSAPPAAARAGPAGAQENGSLSARPSPRTPRPAVRELPHYAPHLSAQLRQDVREELQEFLAEFVSTVTDAWTMAHPNGHLPSKLQPPFEHDQAEMTNPISRSQTATFMFDEEDTWEEGDVQLWHFNENDDLADVLPKPSLLCHRVANVMQQEIQISIAAEAKEANKSGTESTPVAPKALRRSFTQNFNYHDRGEYDPTESHHLRRSISPKAEPFVPGGNLADTLEKDAISNVEVRALLLHEQTEQTVATTVTDATESRYQNSCRSIVLSIEFEQMIGLLVVLNAFTIGLETDFQAKHVGAELPPIYHAIDATFCLAFSLELCLKLYVLGNTLFFCGINMGWNCFDCLVVGFQVADYIAQLVGRKKAKSGLNVTLFRLLRLMRLARIVRVIRAFSLVDDLRTIVASIAASIKSLCWALLVLFIMVYGVSICFTHLVIDAKKAKGNLLLDRDILEHWYGSLFRTMLTMFECIAGGVSWDDAASPLIENVSPWAGVLFVVYIAFSLFALCNVVTGVFVEKAMDCAKEKDDDKLVGYLKDIFHRADTTGSGEIDWEAFEDRLETDEMKEYFRIIDVDMSEAQGIFRLLDVDGGGTVSPLEFVSGCMRLRGSAKAVELSLLMYETKKMNEFIRGKIGLLEQRVTWIGNTLKRSIRAQSGGKSQSELGGSRWHRSISSESQNSGQQF